MNAVGRTAHEEEHIWRHLVNRKDNYDNCVERKILLGCRKLNFHLSLGVAPLCITCMN